MKAFPQNLTANKVALKTFRFQPDSSQCKIAFFQSMTKPDNGEPQTFMHFQIMVISHFTIHALENPVEMDTNK